MIMKLLKSTTLLLIIFGFNGVTNLALAEESIATHEIVEVLPENIQSAFTKETVLKLNKIVRRSYNAINEYDGIINDVRSSVNEASTPTASKEAKQKAEKQIAHIIELEKQSKEALSDMMAAEKELRSSDEVYNEAILAGMIDFVTDVEEEISTQHTALEKKLNEANS